MQPKPLHVFILPSWCPTPDAPLSGTFFVEQAHALAQARPSWAVAFCHFDLARSRIPWRFWQWPRLLRDWLATPKLSWAVAKSGLHEYRVWSPYLPRFGSQNKWTNTAAALARQVRAALKHEIDRAGKPDLIHARAVYPGGVAAVILGREFDIPVALTEHLGPFPPPQLCLPDGSVMPFLSAAYAGAAGHSSDGSVLGAQIVRLGLARTVETLPNFLPDEFGSAAFDARQGGKSFAFLSVGWPSRAKGTDVLLQAFAQIPHNATLSVVGNSPELPFFQAMAVELGVGDRVRWLGAVSRSDMPALFGACDAFVLPSQWECFGVVFIEALASGKPLIATRCGGPEDIVHAGNGLLVPVGGVQELASAMAQMVERAGAYNPLVLRADFLARFSASAVIDKTEHWYRDVIGEPHGSA